MYTVIQMLCYPSSNYNTDLLRKINSIKCIHVIQSCLAECHCKLPDYIHHTPGGIDGKKHHPPEMFLMWEILYEYFGTKTKINYY